MKFIRLLKHELAAEAGDWVEKGLISREQARAILSTYGTDLPEGKGRSLAEFVLIALASLFMGVSVILIVSHNWEDIPRAVRMVSLWVLTLALNSAGLYYFLKDRLKASQIWFLLGSLIYGASIFLIAQIYHLGEYFPNGVLFWALGVLPLGLLISSFPLMLLTTVLCAIWFCLEVSNGYIPWLYILFFAGFFYYCFAQKRSLIIFLAAVAGALSFLEVLLTKILYPDRFIFELNSNHVYFTVGLFILLFTSGYYLERRKLSSVSSDYGLVLRLWAVRFGVLTLLIFSFEGPWEELIKASLTNGKFLTGWCIFLILVQYLLLANLRDDSTDESKYLPVASRENIPSLAFTFAFILIVILLTVSSITTDNAVTLQIAANLGLLAMGIWYITRAMRVSAGSSFQFGVGIILFTGLLRYIDLIGDYIGGSIVFFIAAMIMFASAKLWKKYSAIERKTS
jgi:uncharacterized membrane protein